MLPTSFAVRNSRCKLAKIVLHSARHRLCYPWRQTHLAWLRSHRRPLTSLRYSAHLCNLHSSSAGDISTPLPHHAALYTSVPLGAFVDSLLKQNFGRGSTLALAWLVSVSSLRYTVMPDPGSNSSAWRLQEQQNRKSDSFSSWKLPTPITVIDWFFELCMISVCI